MRDRVIIVGDGRQSVELTMLREDGRGATHRVPLTAETILQLAEHARHLGAPEGVEPELLPARYVRFTWPLFFPVHEHHR